MNREKYLERRRKISQRYRRNNPEKVRKIDRDRKRKVRLKKNLIMSSGQDMNETFEFMKPELYKWARLYAGWNKDFEIDELVNAAFADGRLRVIKKKELLSQKVYWVMKSYIRKVRKDNSIDRLVKLYVKTYGRRPFDEESEGDFK